MKWTTKYLKIIFTFWITFVFLFSHFEFLHLHKLTISISTNNHLGIEQHSINNNNIYFGFQNCLIETFIKSLQIGFLFGTKSFFFNTSFLGDGIPIFKFPLLQNQIQLPTSRAPPTLLA